MAAVAALRDSLSHADHHESQRLRATINTGFMPKNPLKFARRRSSGNVLDDIIEPAEPAAPAVSSFRVLERPEKRINLNGGYPPHKQVKRPFQSPLYTARGKSAEELGAGTNRLVESVRGVNARWLTKGGRGSGGTTNSGSSGYNESSSASARHSSSSTLPSSVDAERDPSDEELFPRKSKTTPMYKNTSDDLHPPRPSFTARAARALSFGQNHDRGSTVVNHVPKPPPLPVNGVSSRFDKGESPPQRERATTTSSYASTAKPEVDLNLGSSDWGSDFASMFDGQKSAKPLDLPPPPPPKSPAKAAFHRTVCKKSVEPRCKADCEQESEPMFPPRTYSRQAFKAEELANLRDDTPSPYSFDRRDSNEGLMSNSELNSPRLDEFAPPVPPHKSGMAAAFLGAGKAGYAVVPDRQSPSLERSSYDSDSGWDKKESGYDTKLSKSYEDDPWVKKFELRDPQGSTSQSSTTSESRSTTMTRQPLPGTSNGPPVARKPLGMPSQAVAGAARSGALSPDSEDDKPLFSSVSSNATPKAAKLNVEKESMFDSSPVGPPSRAIKPQHMRTESGTPKKMTKAQFDRLQRKQNSSADHSEEEANSADEYDEEDDVEHAKRVARQRQKQEANMSVYRQQMKKVTGGGPGDLPSVARPSLDRAIASAPSGLLHLGGIGGQPPPESVRGKPAEDDDEDVPLGILQAHGFPSAGRPPVTQGESDLASQRRASASGSVLGGGAGQGNLPAFARRLPQDPYFGSSLVNPSHRESLGMNSSASVYGAPPSMMPQMQPQSGHPGGLVGVIASEERAKAARRGSPNPATGTYNAPAPQHQMPGMMGMGGRTMTMPNMMSPQTYTPSGNPMMSPMPMMPQMPMMQNPQQDQMHKFMEMQMQVMQNMLAMQQQQLGQTPPPQAPTPDYLGVPTPGIRTSMVSNPGYPPSIQSQAPGQGRSMTMLNPPPNWSVSPGPQRPISAMPTTYGPTGLNISNGGLGPGYTPSIAPTERSNIGQPSRYRPVATGTDPNGRSMSMTSSATLQAFRKSEVAPPVPVMPSRPQSQHQSKATLRIIDKPKGAPKVAKKPIAEEDEEEGWADMRKKRDEKKRFKFGRSKTDSTALSDIYRSFD